MEKSFWGSWNPVHFCRYLVNVNWFRHQWQIYWVEESRVSSDKKLDWRLPTNSRALNCISKSKNTLEVNNIKRLPCYCYLNFMDFSLKWWGAKPSSISVIWNSPFFLSVKGELGRANLRPLFFFFPRYQPQWLRGWAASQSTGGHAGGQGLQRGPGEARGDLGAATLIREAPSQASIYWSTSKHSVASGQRGPRGTDLDVWLQPRWLHWAGYFHSSWKNSTYIVDICHVLVKIVCFLDLCFSSFLTTGLIL